MVDFAAPAPAARPRTRIQTENRRAILDAALQVFSARGYSGATLEEIAGVAGMSKPNLLYYFRRKQDIYRGTLEATLEAWLAPLEALDPEGEPIDEIARYIRAKLAMSREMPEASRLFANEILHGAPLIKGFLETSLRRLVEEKAGLIRQWIAQGRLAPVDPVHLIFMIWGTTQHYADFGVQVDAVLGPGRDAVAEAEPTVLALFLEGLRPR